MKTWERWTFNLLALAVTLSGLVFFWAKYLLVNDDPFALVNHGWQGAAQAVHVVASPGLMLMFGVLLNSHIMKKLGARQMQNRASGNLALAAFLTMTVTGYLLQVITNEIVLASLAVAHIGSGVGFAMLYGVHLLVSVRLARVQAARRLESEAA
jgi:hypothetical protein